MGAKCTENLIEQLLDSRARTPAEAESLDLSRTVASLRVLVAILDVDAEAEPLKLAQRQSMLDGMGASRVALMMACCEADELAAAGLQLGLALLRRGNADAQSTMLAALAEGGGTELRPYDGSGRDFLATMRWRLRLAVKEIHEKKWYLEQQRERRESFAEATAGLSAATVVALRAQLEKDFPARSHEMEVLELLRLMCEGHNQRWQDFLCEQPEALSSVDLLTETYQLLNHLEPEIDETNIAVVQQCVETLTEFVQVPLPRICASLASAPPSRLRLPRVCVLPLPSPCKCF